MKSNPLVSILIPCYNVEAYLPQCLDSVINQTYQDLQIVLVDDGSKDYTFRIAQDYAVKDSRISIFYQENQGVATARNKLLSELRGDYFLFVDSDDWIEPEMVQFLLEKAFSSEAEMVTCGVVVNDAVVSSSFKEFEYDQSKAIERFLYHQELRGSLCNKLMKSSLIKNTQFRKEISYGEDALFCWEILKETKKVIFTDRQLYHYRMNATSISHSAFGSHKLSGHKVWDQITKETEKLYPQYLSIARARSGLESMYLLRDASQRGYRYGEDIKELQHTVKKNIPYIKETRMSGIKELTYAKLICRWYHFAKIYRLLHSLKSR